jgi:hypothetical protein
MRSCPRPHPSASRISRMDRKDRRDVRTMRAELLDCFSSVRAFGDQSHVRFAGQQTGDSLAHQKMVVDRQNPNRTGFATHEPMVSTIPGAIGSVQWGTGVEAACRNNRWRQTHSRIRHACRRTPLKVAGRMKRLRRASPSYNSLSSVGSSPPALTTSNRREDVADCACRLQCAALVGTQVLHSASIITQTEPRPPPARPLIRRSTGRFASVSDVVPPSTGQRSRSHAQLGHPATGSALSRIALHGSLSTLSPENLLANHERAVVKAA